MQKGTPRKGRFFAAEAQFAPPDLLWHLDWCKLIFSAINVSPHQAISTKARRWADWASAAIPFWFPFI
jgi:hypothetical protein